VPSPSPFTQPPLARPSQYRVHVPDPTVIVMRPRRPRGLVISMSVLVTIGLVVGGLLAYGNLSTTPAQTALPGEVAATAGSEPAAPTADHAPGPLAQGAGLASAAPGLPAPTVTALRDPSTPAATEEPAAVAEHPVAPAPADPAPRPALEAPGRPALAVPDRTAVLKAPEPAPAWLQLTVAPADATVTVGGAAYSGSALERMGPFAPGPHALRITAPEHETVEQIVELEPGETERMSLALPAVARGPGKFRVRSSPSGATVLIDGKVRGVTPATLELASGKTYELALSQQGYEPWRTLIEPTVGKTQTIGADMDRIARPRTASARPAAEPPAAEPPAAEPPAAATEPPEPPRKERDISVPASMVGNAGRGRTLFERCRSCHGSSAPSLNPRVNTQSQWSRFLALRRHSRHAELRPLFSVSELADVKAFLLENAADVDRGMAAGVR
jgi:hypothetical protein